MDQTLGISMTKYTIPNILSVYAWIYISDITANTLTLYVNLKQANGTSFVVTEKKTFKDQEREEFRIFDGSESAVQGMQCPRHRVCMILYMHLYSIWGQTEGAEKEVERLKSGTDI